MASAPICTGIPWTGLLISFCWRRLGLSTAGFLISGTRGTASKHVQHFVSQPASETLPKLAISPLVVPRLRLPGPAQAVDTCTMLSLANSHKYRSIYWWYWWLLSHLQGSTWYWQTSWDTNSRGRPRSHWKSSRKAKGLSRRCPFSSRLWTVRALSSRSISWRARDRSISRRKRVVWSFRLFFLEELRRNDRSLGCSRRIQGFTLWRSLQTRWGTPPCWWHFQLKWIQ